MVKNGDPSHGKQLFLASKSQCATCHTLADAGAKGTVGPNLDDAFLSVKHQGFTIQSMEDVIRGQIAYPEPPMPANLVEGQDANDVASYIAKCAGNPSCGVTATRSAPPGGGSSSGGGSTTTSATSTSAAPDGKQIFVSNCGSCHTLKDAGTSGSVGPNLDQLKPSESRAEAQVRHGGGVMPAFQGKLSDAQIKAVAEYVSSATR